jgi:hypothetical protein
MRMSLPKVSEETGEGAYLTRADFVEQMGDFGAELFDRLDRDHRNGEEVFLLNMREIRKEFVTARLPGRGKIVRPKRGGSDSEEVLLMSLSDIASAFRASVAECNWSSLFAPRQDLPAATSTLKLRRGPRGRKIVL